jgi:DNA primase
MIPQAFIQDLLNRLDIVDVVEASVPLKRAGANLVACCPFHSEKSPSFTVSPSKQFYHCFGCGAHGNAIGFLMEYSGLGFVEAIKDLAGRAGLAVPELHGEAPLVPAGATREISEVLLAAAVFYKTELKRSGTAVEYLKARGLTGEIAAHFGLGFAPPGWQGLAAAFPDYRAKVLADAGLVIDGEDGKRYDRFRDRIMFPIASSRGDVLGFGGRVLGQGEPKYLNSPETPVFEKGREVYGLYQARAAIRASARVIVVEGYMDVVALAQHGVGEAVATLGTATTPIHAQKLLRQAGKVVFCFDGDDAGRRAAWRALENCVGQLVDGREVAFAFLPQGEDPDSYIRRAGREKFDRLIADALPLSAFLLRELSSRVDLGSHEGAAKLLKDAKPLIAGISAPMLSLVIRKQVAEMVGLSPEELDRLWGIRTNTFGSSRVRPARPKTPLIATEARYGKLLACLVLSPQSHTAIARSSLIDADSEICKGINELIDFLESTPNVRHSAGALECLRASGRVGLLHTIRQELELRGGWSEGELEQEIQDLLNKITVEKERDEAVQQLNRVSPKDIDQGTRETAHRALRAGKVTLSS